MVNSNYPLEFNIIRYSNWIYSAFIYLELSSSCIVPYIACYIAVLLQKTICRQVTDRTRAMPKLSFHHLAGLSGLCLLVSSKWLTRAVS